MFRGLEMITNFCTRALNELQQYKGQSKEDILMKRVAERLDKSFETYQKELSDSTEYLLRRKEINVLRKLNKLK